MRRSGHAGDEVLGGPTLARFAKRRNLPLVAVEVGDALCGAEAMAQRAKIFAGALAVRVQHQCGTQLP